MINILRLVLGGTATNSYIIHNGKDGIIIDPADSAETILKVVRDQNINIEAILLTHGHGDHIGALNEVRDELNVPVYLSKNDLIVYNTPSMNLAAMLGLAEPDKQPDYLIEDGEVLDFKVGSIRAIETPGHTPGSMCFLIDNAVLVSGDTLFEGSIGRTDFEGGSWTEMKKSLDFLMTLPDDLQVLPGHGEATTIGREKVSNPFITR